MVRAWSGGRGRSRNHGTASRARNEPDALILTARPRAARLGTACLRTARSRRTGRRLRPGGQVQVRAAGAPARRHAHHRGEHQIPAGQSRRAAAHREEGRQQQRRTHGSGSPGNADVSLRPSTAYRLAQSAHRESAVADALAELLGDADQLTRIWAAFGPAERDDPRCVAGAALVGPVEDRAAWSWILDAPSRYEERVRERPVPDPAT